MRFYLILIGIIISTTLFAQNNPLKVNRVQAVLKGNIKNNTDKFWEFAITGYFSTDIVSVPVDDKGNFNKTIWFDGDAQDIYLYLNNDAITISLQKNDTVEINWDTKDFKNTFRVQNTNKIRNNELMAMMALYNKYRRPLLDLSQSLYQEKWSDSVKFIRINDLYNQEIQTVFDNKAADNKILTDIYFQFIGMLQSHNLLPGYSLMVKDTTLKISSFFISDKGLYKTESEEAFKISNNYRDYLFNYVRFNRPFTSISTIGSDYSAAKMAPFSPSWTDYYSALSELKLYLVRDWFVSRSIMFDFEFYSFDDAQAVYKDFVPKLKVAAYADSLAVYYKNALTLKPGNMAPDFTLTGVDGKPVSLKSLKGKVVYIDFWGVGCGPCMADIKESIPKMHEKYKDKNIVFLNICVDTHAAEWKNSLKETGLSGVNLIAEGWNKNPVCKLYGVNGIPHYFIIDADGKMVNNNSPRPSEAYSLYPILDKILSK